MRAWCHDKCVPGVMISVCLGITVPSRDIPYHDFICLGVTVHARTLMQEGEAASVIHAYTIEGLIGLHHRCVKTTLQQGKIYPPPTSLH